MSFFSVRQFFVVSLTVILILAGGFRVTSKASAASRPVQKNYYSVRIQSGDTLWSIAETCCGSSRVSEVRKMVTELKQMNHLLNEDSLQAGAYLMVYQVVSGG